MLSTSTQELNSNNKLCYAVLGYTSTHYAKHETIGARYHVGLGQGHGNGQGRPAFGHNLWNIRNMRCRFSSTSSSSHIIRLIINHIA